MSLTREQVEDWRSDLINAQDVGPWTPLGIQQINALCDMALSSLKKQQKDDGHLTVASAERPTVDTTGEKETRGELGVVSETKEQRIERAYCAANDYINALLSNAIWPESLQKIAESYWQAVRGVGSSLPSGRHPIRCRDKCDSPTFDIPCQHTCKYAAPPLEGADSQQREALPVARAVTDQKPSEQAVSSPAVSRQEMPEEPPGVDLLTASPEVVKDICGQWWLYALKLRALYREQTLEVERLKEERLRARLAAHRAGFDGGDLEEIIDEIRLRAEQARHRADLLAEDGKRLDYVQAQSKGYGRGWIFRNSNTGRGMRLHETSMPDAKPTVREAIDQAREGTGE